MRQVRASTARTIMVLMVDSTDHVTGKTGLTLTITASKAGGAFASISPTVTERGSGWYSLALTTSHLDTLGDFALHITGVSADPADLLLEVVAYNPEDATALGLASIDAAISTRSTYAGADTAGTTTLLARILGTLAAGTHNPQSGDAFARLGAPNGASIAADVATRAPEAGGNLAAVKAKTDNLPASPAAVGSLMGLADDAITAAKIAAGAITATEAPALANLDAAVSTRSTYAGGDTSGTTTLLARLTAIRAGLMDNMDATVSSRLATAGYTAPANADVAAIKVKTDNLPTDPADESTLLAAIGTLAEPGDAMTLTAGAIDAILDDPIEGSVTLRQAIRILMSVAAGETVITDLGGGAAEVTFKSQDGTIDRVFAIMAGSERTSVTVNGG